MFTSNGGVYTNRFKKHAEYYVKHIVYWYCLGWIVPSLIVRACLSQDFFARGNYLRYEKVKRGMI